MILDLIVSKNLARRQLNAGQKAFLGLEYERFYAEAAKAAEDARKSATVGDQNSRYGYSESTRTTADLQREPRWS